MKRLAAAIMLTAALAAPAAALTVGEESAPSPEGMQQLMEASLGAMVPMMGRMTAVMIDAQLKVAERPETASSLARFKRNLYNELVRQGFSKKEALDITVSTPLPAAAPAMK